MRGSRRIVAAAWLVLLVSGCRIDFGDGGGRDQPKPDQPAPNVIRQDKFDPAEMSAALADIAKRASDLTGEQGTDIVAGALQQYERTWPSDQFSQYRERLLQAVPAIGLVGGKARDFTADEVESLRRVR